MNCSAAEQSDKVSFILPSSEERIRGRYGAPTLQKALETLYADGLVILKAVVDVSHVDSLNEHMCSFTDQILQEAENFNHGIKSNILQGPPITETKYLFEDVYFNPYLIQVMNALIGSPPVFNFMKGNTALHSTAGLRQPVHKDITFEHPRCPFYFIANIPLCDFTHENGSTEFWLGTHFQASGDEQSLNGAEIVEGTQKSRPLACEVRGEVYEARRKERPPVRIVAERGDIMIGDLRTWHAGMPNSTRKHRIMLALGYQKAPWYPNYDLRLTLPLSQSTFFMKAGAQPVEVRANFVENEEVERVLHLDNFDFGPTGFQGS